jgi:hypothetical protein
LLGVGTSCSDEVLNTNPILKIKWAVDSSTMKELTVLPVDQISIVVMEASAGVGAFQ